MEQLVQQMQMMHEEKEAEIQNYKAKCSEQEVIILAIKTAARVDKLQQEFDNYKQDAEAKIMSHEISALQSQAKIKNLSKKQRTLAYAKKKLQEKVEELTKELDNEKRNRNELVGKTSTKLQKLDKSAAEKNKKNTSMDLAKNASPSVSSGCIDLVVNDRSSGVSNGDGKSRMSSELPLPPRVFIPLFSKLANTSTPKKGY